jgi:signal transduction histidine kinase
MTNAVDRPTRILLIDDEELILQGLSAVLKQQGYDPLVATSGAQGLYLATEVEPDLIICDVTMPPPDGFDVREILNRQPDFARIPFIFVTGRGDLEDRLHGIKTGADDYITKPFNVPELLARVEALLRRVHLSREEGASEAASQLEVVRQEILHTFTHELRTPLSHITLSLNLALREKFGENDEDQAAFLKSAVQGAERLRGLVDDLIFLAAYDRGCLDAYRQEVRIEFHFTRPVRQCIERWEDKNLDVTMNVARDLEIYAPRDQFGQAVVHLVDNACKFSPAGGHITVDLQPNGDGGCVLTVIDEGPGIPPEHRQRVFERYYQVSRGDGRHYEGLGVGLTIARAVARSLGGDVEILGPPSRLAQGCAVRMTIAPGQSDTSTPH